MTTTTDEPTTPDPESSAVDPLRHREICDNPRVHQFVGKHGDQVEQCSTCRAWQVITPAEELQTAHLPPGGSTTAGENWTRWRCREHDHPVNWRGRGCAACTARMAKKPRRKKKRPPENSDAR